MPYTGSWISIFFLFSKQFKHNIGLFGIVYYKSRPKADVPLGGSTTLWEGPGLWGQWRPGFKSVQSLTSCVWLEPHFLTPPRSLLHPESEHKAFFGELLRNWNIAAWNSNVACKMPSGYFIVAPCLPPMWGFPVKLKPCGLAEELEAAWQPWKCDMKWR